RLGRGWRWLPGWAQVLVALVGLPALLSMLVRVPPAPGPDQEPGPLARLGRVLITSCDPRVVHTVGAGGRISPRPRYACPRALVFDRTGITYVSDDRSVRVVGPDGVARGLDGVANPGPLVTRRDVLALREQLPGRDAVGVGVDGTLYVRDIDNRRVRLLTSDGRLVGLAGEPEPAPARRAPGDTSSRREQVAVDALGAVYVADTEGNRIRKIQADEVETNWAGTGQPASSGDLAPASQAGLQAPQDVTIDRSGRLFVTEGSRLRRIDRDGTISTVAGTGGTGPPGNDAPAVLASLRRPTEVALDGRGNVYVVDLPADAIRRVAPDGIITTLRK
ncbi:MAG: hypothetical protein JWN57_46, partial [Frankiales bacterium]|nr:hypothetical protein [Frankiales bacterium]